MLCLNCCWPLYSIAGHVMICAGGNTALSPEQRLHRVHRYTCYSCCNCCTPRNPLRPTGITNHKDPGSVGFFCCLLDSLYLSTFPPFNKVFSSFVSNKARNWEINPFWLILANIFDIWLKNKSDKSKITYNFHICHLPIKLYS